MVEELSERQRAILRMIVEQYVATARPVASEGLAAHYGLTVSSATIRNTMADLERLGYIAQPHTSAGRVPTDKGYRYFVGHLMGPATLTLDEQRTIEHQFHQVQMNMDEWMHLAAAVLARMVRNAAVVTSPQSTAARLKHFELLGLTETSAMVVLVTHDGRISQQLLPLEESWDQERLSSLAAHLIRLWHDMTATQISRVPLPDDMPALAGRVAPLVVGLLARLEEPGGTGIYREGLAHILEQPEFRETERMRQMFDLLEGGGVLLSIIPTVRASEGVQVIIGDEHQSDQMRNCSVVVARYGLSDNVSGMLGVIGPTRMPYGRAVSSVRYLSDLLGSMLYQIYGEGNKPAP
jgi:heat-inducible transcriptional repressor